MKRRLIQGSVAALFLVAFTFIAEPASRVFAAGGTYSSQIKSYGILGYDTNQDGVNDVVVYDSDDLKLLAEGLDQASSDVTSLQERITSLFALWESLQDRTGWDEN